MPLEKRIRVEIFLPINKSQPAYEALTRWLAEELALTRGGSTVTSPFKGLYRSASGEIVQDEIQVLFCDFNLNPDDEAQVAQLGRYLADIRQTLVEALQEDDLWIVYHPVIRFMG